MELASGMWTPPPPALFRSPAVAYVGGLLAAGSLGHPVNEYRMLRHQMLAKVRLIRPAKTPY
jgi:hypothetical protein